MPVSLVILILYIAALFGISWYAKKRSEGNNENYALAGRKLSAPLICVTIIGLAVGGASTIGVYEHAFRVGLSAGWYTIAWALGAIAMGLFMAKVMKVNYAKETSIAIEVAMQNSGLAVALATVNFATNPLASLPGAVFSVWHNVSGSMFASYRLKGLEEKDGEAVTSM